MLASVANYNSYLNEKNNAIMYFASQIPVAKRWPFFALKSYD